MGRYSFSVPQPFFARIIIDALLLIKASDGGKVDVSFVSKSKEAWLPAKDMRGSSLRYEKV